MNHEGHVGAIEAGGTKMVCAVGTSWQEIRDGEKFVVPTTSPEETMAVVMDWFVERDAETPLAAIGVASFGPIDFATDSIAMSTPKDAWRGVSWRRHVSRRLRDAAIGLDTDTNAAGLAEWRWGAAQDRQVAAYVTVGTGIGGALIINGAPVHGLLHPEMGHMVVPRQRGDEFAGTCPAHGDCLEGLACGLAVTRRWGHSGPQFPPDHAAWELESDYLALALVNIITIASPEVIIMGGGIMAVEGLLDRVRTKVRDRMAGYVAKEELASRIGEYIVAPGLGSSSGVVGAYALGSRAALDERK
jgi:fructokinase